MANTVAKYAEGTLCIDSGAPAEDADHLVTRSFNVTIYAPGIGAAASGVHICELQADITVTGFYCVSSMALATDANNPDITLAKSDRADGALVLVSSALGLDTALAIQTELAGTIVAAEKNCTTGQSLYASVTTNGTPAVITELATITCTVEYTLTN